jgi:SAM-dependent methyltransferase
VDVIGVDLDETMLSTARRKAPALTWHCADLAAIDLGRTFDVILLAGNVMIFLTPGTEAAVVGNLVRHLAPGGRLVAGFSLRPGQLTVEEYERIVAAAGPVTRRALVDVGPRPVGCGCRLPVVGAPDKR